jgi:hypothetical protein
VDIEAQAARLAGLAAAYAGEVAEIDRSRRFDFHNPFFQGFDAAVYYSLVRDLKPRRVIEVGGGFSTRIVALALLANAAEGHPGALTVIEPYPAPRLLDAGVEMELIGLPVEKVDLALFQGLQANDILFVDSSHVLRTGGDVVHEFLEIYPRLASGVWLHLHDIFLPFDYPPDWLLGLRRAFNEQYMLEAFLAFNAEFRPQLCSRWIVADAPDVSERLWPGAPGNQPCSFWMSRQGQGPA